MEQLSTELVAQQQMRLRFQVTMKYFEWWQDVEKYYHLPRTAQERRDLDANALRYAQDCFRAGLELKELETAFTNWKQSRAGWVAPNAVQIIQMALAERR